MSIRRSTIIEKAQHLVLKGKIKEAIREWEKLAAETPHDGNIYNAIGDLHLKAQDKEKATVAFIKAGEAFEYAAFELKSIALYKKALKIDPSRYDVHAKLADVYAERGLVSGAIEGYLKAARHHAKQGDFSPALTVYQKLSELDPGSEKIQLECAALCVKHESYVEAAAAYKKLLSIYESKNMTTEADDVRRTLHELEPNLSETPSLEEIEEAQNTDESLEYVSPLMSDGSVSAEETFIAEPPENAMPEDSSTVNDKLEDLIVPESEPMAEEQTCYQSEYATMDVRDVEEIDTKNENELTFEHALTEAEVYIQYGLIEKAIHRLQAVSKAFPLEVKPYLKLKEIYTQQGMNDEAIKICRLLISRYEASGDKEALQKTREGLKRLESFTDEISSTKEQTEPAARPASLHQPPAPPSKEAAESPHEEYVDLHEMLSESFNSDYCETKDTTTHGFKNPETPVEYQTAVETEEQYDLGMACKEMNRMPEAISAFERAAVGARFEDAMMMLALCHRDTGDTALAIKVLESALSDQRHPVENQVALKYELALLYELTENKKCAHLFQEVYQIDPTFRDVSKKYRHSAPSKRGTSTAPDSESNDGTSRPGKSTPYKNQASFLQS
ncbi:MAG: tetratricopeptide repeat protein [Nitrospiria bacterium]